MYIPRMFRVDDRAEVVRFMRSHPFGIMVSQDGVRPTATHVPFHIAQDGETVYLRGHLAHANPQWKILTENPQTMAIFQGPHAYISSSWYEQANVPTWNYTAVHAYGTARILPESELRTLLQEMLVHYEHGRPNGRLWDTFPPGFLDKQLKAIVGFEIEITEIQAAFKLSQNRDDTDYGHIVEHLSHSDDSSDREVGDFMRTRRPTY